MGSISSEEIISILKTEIENYDMVSKDQEVGTVIWVGDGIATIYGIEHALPVPPFPQPSPGLPSELFFLH